MRAHPMTSLGRRPHFLPRCARKCDPRESGRARRPTSRAHGPRPERCASRGQAAVVSPTLVVDDRKTGASVAAERKRNRVWALAIHGGAGAGDQEAGAEALVREIRQALAAVLDAGARLLSAGGTALDAVEDAVARLEDSPLFNAGKGSVLNERGEFELDASIM